jgi:hypothetical protein
MSGVCDFLGAILRQLAAEILRKNLSWFNLSQGVELES